MDVIELQSCHQAGGELPVRSGWCKNNRRRRDERRDERRRERERER
jgi:hypothetical protein